MKRHIPTLSYALVVMMLAIFTSCNTYKDIGYLQNVARYTSRPMDTLYAVKVKPLDKLFITAFVEGSQVAAAFNVLEPSSSEETPSLVSTGKPIEYLVTTQGTITMPLIGEMKVDGYTTAEIKSLVEEKLANYFAVRPIVTVRFNNYSFTVIGEVAKPGMYNTDLERINIFEALALAGDMTIYGRRDVVKIIREYADGTKSIGTLNLNEENILDSPYFYIEQDDVIYVEPNLTKSRNADVSNSASLWIKAGSIGISILSLIFSIIL